MPDAADPRATLFLNNRFRPICERVRGLLAEAAVLADEFALVKEVLGENEIDDGRAGEGVNTLRGSDVKATVRGLLETAAALNASEMRPVVMAACVRPIQIS